MMQKQSDTPVSGIQDKDAQDMLKCLPQVENTASVQDISTQRQKMTQNM